ncbi:MAG TPA: DUF4331 domain-containing protein [Actinophytocola sp.]|uniref:DUF4331 domain-containing protein n=1 Tax=Actinophytocola sp. TaxID=1872138 RepID=UPI002DDDB6F6|nr:DUF4331 domain-containing protein [Actinophytocola sp.]HEV2781612.1 DUF4331 domain-containing protein [Actinophytocola sp.]
MSSHREAPEIAKDPVADSTDVYAFVSPDKPDTVTLIANYVPLQPPAGGPNFYEFGDDVLYQIHIDNNGDGKADVTYQFNFDTEVRNPNTFLYNTGPILALDSPNWNRRQFYSVTRVDSRGRKNRLAKRLPCPPCNIGPLSTPDYAKLADAAVNDLGGGRTVFAGQRAEGFYVDLGAVFDLLDPRPFADAHEHFGLAKFPTSGQGVNATKNLNVHSIVLQVPIGDLTRDGYTGGDVDDPRATIGVWTSASRQRVRMYDTVDKGKWTSGPFWQVSRLAMPLFNEVIVPMGRKDFWNAQPPHKDSQFAQFVAKPEVANLLPVLFPGVFPNLDALNKSGKPRADLLAILLTGIPSGLIPGFQNFTGKTQADLMRLNTAIKPSDKPSILGLLGGDLAGFPNGRRVFDDVVAIELRAVAGATYALVDNTFTPDAAASQVDDGVTPDDLDMPYLDRFPYLGVPHSGFDNPSK